MSNLKFKLLAATILVAPAMPAHAQFSFPTVELDGVGASTVADVVVKTHHCLGANQLLGVNNGTTSTVTPAGYQNTGTPSNGKPSLDCLDGVNSDIYNGTTTYTGKYVSTGSGFGRQQWRLFTNQFTGLAGSINPFGTWSNVQYAFSEAPATAGDMTAYTASAQPTAGKAIQFPLYVVPISFAYNPTYGTNNSVAMTFNVQVPQTINAVAAGGLRLTKNVYCKIWNGTITNWNHADIAALNKNPTTSAVTPLYDTVNDTAGRWTAEGAPIRLVGRADASGGTDVFTRALAAQCATTAGNKFARAAEALPYATGGTIDIRGLRANSPYFPTNASSTIFAGTTQSLNGYVYDRTNNRFCLWNEATGGACSATPAAVTFAQFQTGGSSAGLFTVADGSPSLEAAIRLQNGANGAIVSPSNPLILLNGKFGYIGADFVAGSAGRSLHSAALQQGTSNTVFLMPNSKNATTAFGKVLPPQTSSNGTFNTVDTRLIYNDLTNPGAGTTTPVRSNPLHWVNVLYPASGATLANPTTGYAVTGAAHFLTYTCFNSTAKRAGVANFIGHLFGNIKKKAAAGGTPTSISLSANTFKGNTATEVGILTKSNIALPATAWQKAITETFLKKSTQVSNGTPLSSLNLYIQTKQATSSTDFTANVDSNSSCTVDPEAGGTPTHTGA